jgi:hypothetical protein
MLLLQTFAVAAAAWLPLYALAQQSAQADPARAEEAVPPAVYRSAFAAYQSIRDGAATPDKVWSEVNHEAAKIGGHAGQIRETTVSGQSADESPVSPPADRHGMHHKH